MSDNTETETETETPELPKLTKKQKRALFDAFVSAEKAVTEAEAAVQAARADLKTAVEAIATQMGSGPFRYAGRELRPVRNKHGWLMRGASADVEEI